MTKFHVGFPLSGFRGYFNDRLSLFYAMGKFPLVGKAVENASRFLEIPISRLGITGSTALGRRGEHSDVDLVIFGTVAQNRETAARIADYVHRTPEARVVEFGKLWPLRFIHQGIEICPAYVYIDLDEVPLRNCTVELVKDDVQAYGTVRDDTHAIFMPPVVTLSDVWLDGKRADDICLIVYDGSLRGVLPEGAPRCARAPDPREEGRGGVHGPRRLRRGRHHPPEVREGRADDLAPEPAPRAARPPRRTPAAPTGAPRCLCAVARCADSPRKAPRGAGCRRGSPRRPPA